MPPRIFDDEINRQTQATDPTFRPVNPMHIVLMEVVVGTDVVVRSLLRHPSAAPLASSARMLSGASLMWDDIRWPMVVSSVLTIRRLRIRAGRPPRAAFEGFRECS